MQDRTTKQSAYLHTIDLCVLRYCRDTQALEILLNKRDGEPFAGHWALPGIVVNGDVVDLSLEDAVERLRASSKVDMPLAWIEQVGTVGDAFRDPAAGRPRPFTWPSSATRCRWPSTRYSSP